MEIAVGRARGDDYEALCRLLEGVDHLHRERLPHLFQATPGPARSREYIEGLLANPQALVLVAEAGGDPVGCLLAELRASPPIPIFVPRLTAVIDTLVVASGWRRQGVGRALMEAAHAWAREHGADDLELTVYEFNEGASAFYQALGYEVQLRRLTRRVTPRSVPATAP